MISKADFIEKFDMMYRNTGQKMLYYSNDKKKTVLIEQVHILTSGINVINQPDKISEPQIYENIKLTATFLKPNTFMPQQKDHIQIIEKRGNSIIVKDEYVIETVVPIVINSEIVQYTVYQNNQEVSIWTS